MAVFAGKGKGIIYVQGEQVRTVDEKDMLSALYDECVALADRVRRGEAILGRLPIKVAPPI